MNVLLCDLAAARGRRSAACCSCWPRRSASRRAPRATTRRRRRDRRGRRARRRARARQRRSCCSRARSPASALWLVGPEKLEGVAARRAVPDRRSLLAVLLLHALPGRRARRAARRAATCRSTTSIAASSSRWCCSPRSARWRSRPPAICSSLFVALETMSLGVYCMIGLRRGNVRASEAALKYFLLGSFAAALHAVRRRAPLRRDRPHRLRRASARPIAHDRHSPAAA